MRFLGLPTVRDILNINTQVVTEMDKIKEIEESIRGDQSESLIGFDETLDYRTFIHQIISNDDLGTIAHTDPLLLATRF